MLLLPKVVTALRPAPWYRREPPLDRPLRPAGQRLRDDGRSLLGPGLLAERWLAYLYLAAGALGIFNAFAPGYPGFDTGGLLGLSAAAFVAAAVLLRARGRLPIAALHGFLAAGTACIGAAIHFTQGVPNAGAMFYLWVALYAFYFFARPAASGHMVLVGASYAAAIALRPPPFSPIAHWGTTIATMVIAGAFVGHLKARLDATLARVSHLAVTDELTGLPNRRGWLERAHAETARAARRGESPTVALIDLDGFKEFNDRHGHPAGDRLLRECAGAWRMALRDMDFLARLGGDEFAALLPDCPAASAIGVADRLQAVLPHDVTCSVGIAHWRAEETIEQTMERADAALYEAKRGAGKPVVAPSALQSVS